MIMKKYVKPTTEAVVYDHDIADAACGVIGNWETSLASGSEYQLCAHFPVKGNHLTCTNTSKKHSHTSSCYQEIKYYTGNPTSNSVLKLKVTGHHQVTFSDDFTGITCDVPSDVDSNWSSYHGCGWKKYDGNDTNCHFFGKVFVDGTEITQTGPWPEGVSKWTK